MNKLRLIMAVSLDGYVATGPTDNMSWTGEFDKQVFRLLTSVGGVIGAGAVTERQLPKLPGREVVCISRKPGVKRMTLGTFAHKHPGAWLIGGQTVALDALICGLVGEVFLCPVPVMLKDSSVRGTDDLVKDQISPWLVKNKEWWTYQQLAIGNSTVECFRETP